jgi:Flp pilus assembly protein TadD
LGDYAGALADFDETLRRGNPDPVVRRARGDALAHLGRPDEAEEDCIRCLVTQPDDPEVRVVMGRIALARRDYDEAVARTRRALEINDDRDFYSELGLALLLAGHTDEAAAAYDRALGAGGEDVEAARIEIAFWTAQQPERVASPAAQALITRLTSGL